MFENLSDRLERSFKILKGEGKITEINVAETLKDVRRALLDADVNYKVAKTFTDTVKQKALGMNVLTAIKPGQLMVKLVHDEMAELMGGEAVELNLEGRPTVIMMAGLNGAGKTTMSGKQVDVPIHLEEGATDPVQVALNAIAEAKAKSYDVVIIDTAGRQSIDEELMQQAEDIKRATEPHETLLVVDAMTGQDAVNTAKTFNERLEIDGVILSKLDGDTRGGAALSIRNVVDKPIKFIGTGEKMEALDVFHPDRMADRILGMGDVVSLVERAQQQFDLEEAKRLQKKMAKNKFGVGKAIKDVDIDDNAFKGIEAIIFSMTPKERHNPEILNLSRKQRIAKGAGRDIKEVNQLIKQFDQMRKVLRMFSSPGGMANMAKMAGMMKGGFPGGMPKL